MLLETNYQVVAKISDRHNILIRLINVERYIS